MILSRLKGSCRIALAVVLAGTVMAAHAQFTHPRPMQRAADEYETMLLKGEFDALDRVADKARTEGTLLSDGMPLLAALYNGVAGCVCGSSLTDELWKMRGERLAEWVRRKPGSATGKLGLAMYPVPYAWYARGTGYSNTVSKEAMALFRERMETGRKNLEALDATLKRDPGWFKSMLDVAVVQAWPRERFDALFEQGAKIHPGYLPIYLTAAGYHSPRWYGSPRQLREFVDAAVARTRSSMGDTLHGRLSWSNWTTTMYEDGQAEWRLVKAGLERINADYPDPWNLNGFAVMACMANDWLTLDRLMKKIGDKPVMASWSGSPEYYQRCRAKAELEAKNAGVGGAGK